MPTLADMLQFARQQHAAGQLAAAEPGLPRFLIGYSLGGNVTLKLAGELGPDAAEVLTGVVAVSTPIDLGACVRALGRPGNALYQQRFVRSLIDRYLERARLHPTVFPTAGLEGVRTVYSFDNKITAPAFSFRGQP